MLLCSLSLLNRFTFFPFFFFNDTATTEIYTLSLHDALPIWTRGGIRGSGSKPAPPVATPIQMMGASEPSTRSSSNPAISIDRKSTRLNSSHGYISYAVFCLKKKKPANDKILETIMVLLRNNQ